MSAQNIEEVQYTEEEIDQIIKYDTASGYFGVESYTDKFVVDCAKVEFKTLNKEFKKYYQKHEESQKLNKMWGRMTWHLGLELTDKIIEDMTANGEHVEHLAFAVTEYRDRVYKDPRIKQPKIK